jgi:ABC-type dipeptide/oligopeptide/nickel transport system permease component
VIDVLSHDHVRTARAKGVPERVVLRRHVLRNVLIPIATVLGLQFGRMLGGVVVIEAVFAWPGMGSLLLGSVESRDYPVIQGTLLLFLIAFIVVNLATDIAYGLIDPRIRLAGGARRP